MITIPPPLILVALLLMWLPCTAAAADTAVTAPKSAGSKSAGSTSVGAKPAPTPSVASSAQGSAAIAARLWGLPELLAYAQKHAAVVRLGEAVVARGRAAVAAAAPRLPTNPIVRAAAGPRLGSGGSALDFRLGIKQSFAIGGQLTQRRRHATTVLTVAKTQQSRVRWNLHVRVHQLFFEALVAAERVGQAKLLLKFSQDLRAMVRRQARVGHTAPMAVLVVDADVARAQENLALATLTHNVALTQLQTLIGWQGAPLTGLSGVLPPTTQTHDPATLRRWMLASHPVLKQDAAAVAAAQQAVVLADRMATPNITLGISYGREGSAAPGPANPEHVMLATVAIPLAISQKNQGPRAMARANVLAAKARLAADIQQLSGRLRVGVLSLATSQKRVRLYSDGIIPALEQNLALLLKAFAVGEVNLNTVSLTRQRLLQATERYIDARRRYFIASARLEGVVGRDIFVIQEKK